MKSLLIGSGNSTEKKMVPKGHSREFTDLTTLDLQDADVLHDLNELPYPFQDSEFDEIHAYEVLEHCGTQGDFRFFFGQFNEFHRILRQGGLICLSVPNYKSIWAFGDPGHTRVLPWTVFNYLQEDFYQQLGNTHCADYRHLIKGYWQGIEMQETEDRIYVVMQVESE